MPLSIFLLVLAAAALHASWNAIVKRGPDKFLGTVLVTGSAALLSAAALPFLPFPAAHSWPWLAASVLLQVTYYGLVARCYQQVDMSLAYPLMRGSAPILVALAGTLLGEPLPAAAWLGMPSDRAGRLIALASGYPKDEDALQICADARVLGATLFAGTTVTHVRDRFRHAYLAPAQGVIFVNGQRVAVGDGVAAIDEPELTITAEEDAEFVLVTSA